MTYKFAPASENESIVYGSARPKYNRIDEWIEFMGDRQIKRVCCLLSTSELKRYDDLLAIYREIFGIDRVFWSPIEDFRLVASNVLQHQILPFLFLADRNNEKVIVHCAGGVGRTGHILAAWLIAGRGFSQQEAIATVKRMGKNPREAILAALFLGRNSWRVARELNALWDECLRIRKLNPNFRSTRQ